jgi:hypothetical protein
MRFLVRLSRPGFAWIAALAILAAATPAAFAQSDTAAISGFVRDPSGANVPNATVNIKNEATGVERRVTSNDTGYYVASSLPPGFYTVSVEATGFKRFEKTNNKLDPSISTTVDANMQVGSATEVVNVVAEVQQLQSETATLGKLITQEEVKNIPLNGRNPLFLALLKAGVSGGAPAGVNFGLSTAGLNINGSRTQDNLVTFDGAVAVRTRSNGTSIGVADVDAVQEIQVLTANYNAEYGRSAGGQVRIVTKSGAKDFHVDLYEFFRNSAMNANSWTRNRTIGRQDISGRAEPFRYNQFGYVASGPVTLGKFNRDRNKLFWLWSQEWVKQRQDPLTTIRVPSAAMGRGDFSELLTAPNVYFNAPQYVRDPLLTGNCSATDQTACFPGNIIPANRLSGQGRALLNSYPAAIPGFNLGGNNFLQTRGAFQNQRKDNLSVDFNPAVSHYLRFRWQNYELTDAGAFRAGTDRAPSTLTRPNDTASLNYIWTLRPNLINETLFAASADRVKIAVQTEGDRFKRSVYGINYPYLFQAKEIFDKIPTIEIQNFATIDGGPYPSSSSGPIWQLSNNMTWITGSHTVKFGGYWERAGQNDFDQINVAGVPGGTNNQNGRFVFTNTRPGGTGLAIANAAMGLYDTYAELGNRSYTPYRGHMYEAFLQDSWKLTPKLRVEMGLRFSRIQPYYSQWRNMLVFDPSAYDPAKAVTLDPRTGFLAAGTAPLAQYNGMVIPGDGWPDSARGRIPIADSGEFNSLFRGSKEFSKIHNIWQPRLGFAYQLNDKTVIRSGAGRFVTRLGVSDSVFLGGNPPLQPTASTTNGLVDNPAGAGRVSGFPLTVTTQDPIFKNPEAWTWNVTVQREITPTTVVEVGYVGRKSLFGQRERNLNQLRPGTIQANPGVPVDFLRPYKGYATIRTTNNEADSWYNGLQLSLSRRFAKGLSMGAAYTYSKLFDDGSAQRDVIPDAYDANELWGPSSFDRRHVAVINTIYELPFLKNASSLGGRLLGGWQLSGLVQFQTGTPFSVGTGDDFAGVGPGSGAQFWRVNGSPNLADPKFSEGAADNNYYFTVWGDPAARTSPVFTRPAAGTFVKDRVRNILYNPGFQNWTGALFKNFVFAERHKVQFRGEVFNIPNHPNWSGADTNPTSGTFGKVTAKNFERTFQLSLRYSF